jgi:hypothetical protein
LPCTTIFSAHELGRAVEVDRVDRLVGRERDDVAARRVDRGVDDVLRPRCWSDRLERVVLARRHLLHRAAWTITSTPRARTSARESRTSPMKKRSGPRREARWHLGLLELVAAEDTDAAGPCSASSRATKR